MAISIPMPVLSAGMTEAAVARWLKAEGDSIAKGEAIAEVETDKATLELEAEADGVLGRILAPAGTTVAVNDAIALLLAPGEMLPAETPASAPVAPAPVPVESPAPAAAPASPTDESVRLFASPLARRIARDKGVALEGLTGSGPRGRIVRRDVEAARPASAPMPLPVAAPVPVAPAPVPAAPEAPPPAPATPAYGGPHARIPHTSMRRAIARRLSESKRTIPHFYLSSDLELDALLALRATLNERLGGEGKLSVNDFIVKAAALALRQVPEANAVWTDDAVLRLEDVDVCVAVATDGGLITPVVRHADAKGLATLSREVKDLAARARAGSLKPEEYQGGGFTISNLGMYGVGRFAAIINPPQSCILAVGAAERKPVVRGDAVEIRTIMTATLSVDHRSVDGAVGARFLAALKTIVEEPLRLML